MANKTLNNVEIYLDTRTKTQWESVTKVIPMGFVCVELGDDGTSCRLKVGDGSKNYANLPYISGDIDVDQVESIVEEALSDYYTKDETTQAIHDAIAGIGSVFTLKGRVDTVEELPSEGNKQGDVWLVGTEESTSLSEYYWTGTYFDFMGTTTTVDLTEYYKKTEVDALLDLKANAADIERDYIKTTDKLILNCKVE